jgi:hypothetical protein
LATGLFGLGGGPASYHGVSRVRQTENRRAANDKIAAAIAEIAEILPGVVKRLEKEFEEVSVPERRKIANEIRRRKMLFA